MTVFAIEFAGIKPFTYLPTGARYLIRPSQYHSLLSPISYSYHIYIQILSAMTSILYILYNADASIMGKLNVHHTPVASKWVTTNLRMTYSTAIASLPVQSTNQLALPVISHMAVYISTRLRNGRRSKRRLRRVTMWR